MESALQHAHGRLQHLYEISKLLADFENVDETFDTALGVAARTLPLQSAILIQVEEGHSRMILWPAGTEASEEMKVAREHMEEAFAYLVGAPSTESLHLKQQTGRTPLPPQERVRVQSGADRRFIVIPLVVKRRTIFGALQLEAAQPLKQPDLVFVNAIANQLAIALDRDRAWKRDISQRDEAQVQRLEADDRRETAETLSQTLAVLAARNRHLFEEAQHAIQIREQILAIVSHDLKSPLGAVLMAAMLLERSLSEDPKSLRTVQRIKGAIERMNRLIGDLLDFASIEAGRLSIQRVPADALDLTREAVAGFESVAEEKGVTLAVEGTEDLPPAYCDPGRLQQVLANLIGNALNVLAPGGNLRVGLEAQDDQLLFTVSDTGPGIAQEDAAHLFERYWRGEGSGYRGTGLGLAISRGIVHAHGGRIWLESQLGEGTTFFFTIPASRLAASRA